MIKQWGERMPRLCLALLLFCLTGQVWALQSAPRPRGPAPVAEPLHGLPGRPRGQAAARRPAPVAGRSLHPGARRTRQHGQEQLGLVVQGAPGQQPPAPAVGYLEANYPLLDHIKVFLFEPDGHLQEQESGDSFAFAQRPVQVRNFWFPSTCSPAPTPCCCGWKAPAPSSCRCSSAPTAPARRRRKTSWGSTAPSTACCSPCSSTTCSLHLAARVGLPLVPGLQPQRRPAGRLLRRHAVRCCPSTWPSSR